MTPSIGLISVEWAESIATIWLDAPPGNRMTLALFDALERAVFEVLSTSSLSGVILRGRGRHFSSGADVEELERHLARARPGEVADAMIRHGRVLDALEHAKVPTIAAIEGCCLGSALELALSCHLRVATGSALIGLPEASFGLMPGQGGITRTVSLIGRAAALDLALSGRSLDAEEAARLGLVDRVVPRHRGGHDTLALEAVRLAARLGPKGPDLC